MRSLTIHPLTPERIAPAFPLVQTAFPDVTLAEWAAFAKRLLDENNPPGTGILSVLSERDYIAGLAVHHVERDLRHGPALIADHFIALDLFGRGAVVQALAEALETLARGYDCNAVHILIPENAIAPRSHANVFIEVLRAVGHRAESRCLCKRLTIPDKRTNAPAPKKRAPAPSSGGGPAAASV
ncbi:MAG: hypothetical protein D6826_08905 [Alphaproteobacteria bacterium]|nr:MAG: hypothetical protein D6826_08905 [Alphaproteobacteria bacterium]